MDDIGLGMVFVELNGEQREIPQGLNVKSLLAWMGTDASRVAVELNRQIVQKGEWEQRIVEAGAEVEVVMFVGGGKS